MIQAKLNELRKVFDQIERYGTGNNVGLRSICNLGVWLSVYTLTQEKEQFIAELANAAGIKSDERIKELKILIDELALPSNLQQAINGYEKANGKFKLTVRTEGQYQNVIHLMNQHGYEFLIKYLILNTKQECDMAFDMNNEIKFNWAKSDDGTLAPAIYSKGTRTFTNGTNSFEKIAYLFARSSAHLISYGIVEHGACLFHVANFTTLESRENEKAEQSQVYLIEPVHQTEANLGYLSSNYFDIIQAIQQAGLNNEFTYKKLDELKLSNASVDYRSINDPKWKTRYSFTVGFPQIAEELITTENRPGAYSHFLGKHIASIRADKIEYLGKRQLKYDEKGGEVKNKESFSCTAESACVRQENYVSIQYTTQGPYMMVYQSPTNADSYPFLIVDPTKNLVMEFQKNQSFCPKPQTTKGFATDGFSTFSTAQPQAIAGTSDDMRIDLAPTPK